MAPHAVRAADRPVTTLDLLKTAALVAVMVDHVGLYFDPGEDWWRVVGRLAAPVFAFLIGFARTRRVPPLWFALGLLLTTADVLTGDPEGGPPPLNILINFALIRLALPLVERAVMPRPWRLAALACVFAGLAPLVDAGVEYGSEAWLWALAGLAQRRALDGVPAPGPAGEIRDGLLAGTALVYLLREVVDFEFETPETIALVGLVAGLALVLRSLRPAELAGRPPAPVAALLRLCGRRSLEIYAVSLFAMQILAYAME